MVFMFLKCAFVIQINKRELLVNKTDLQALTLVGPTRQDPVLDPLPVLHLAN